MPFGRTISGVGDGVVAGVGSGLRTAKACMAGVSQIGDACSGDGEVMETMLYAAVRAIMALVNHPGQLLCCGGLSAMETMSRSSVAVNTVAVRPCSVPSS